MYLVSTVTPPKPLLSIVYLLLILPVLTLIMSTNVSLWLKHCKIILIFIHIRGRAYEIVLINMFREK